MTMYNHAYDIAFSLNSKNEDEKVTAEELIFALKKRITDLEKNGDEIIEACGKPFDTYEYVPEKEAEAKKFYLYRITEVNGGVEYPYQSVMTCLESELAQKCEEAILGLRDGPYREEGDDKHIWYTDLLAAEDCVKVQEITEYEYNAHQVKPNFMVFSQGKNVSDFLFPR